MLLKIKESVVDLLSNVVSLLSVLSGSSSELNEFSNSLFLEEVTIT